MRQPHVIVSALDAMLSMVTPAAQAPPTIRIGTTPSFIFLPLYAAEPVASFTGEGPQQPAA